MIRSRLLSLTIIVLLADFSLTAQPKAINRDKYQIHIVETKKDIVVDGILDEEPWMTAEHCGDLHRVTPTDTGFAIAQTDVRLTYDESNFYLAVICYDPSPGIRPIQSLRRDFNFNSNDNFMVFIDTYNDQNNGFAFGVSAAGVQRDGVMSGGNSTLYSWDTKWKSAVKNYDDRWVAEISIPFRSIRYFDGETEWGINFGRFDLKTNEKSAWGPMPRQFTHSNLAFTGTLLWDKPLKKTGMGFSLIPYVTGKVTKDKVAATSSDWKANGGFDTKMILSTSMNLDLTVNPDYSQVEEDQQVTNLDRFELFFPERRQFFLENSDLFAGLGRSGAQPFFSRRVGLNAPVIAGGRLSGQIGDNWRIGLMDMQTGDKDNIPSGNFAVGVLQRKLFSRSNIVAFLVNKQLTNNNIDSAYSGYTYNRVAGLEYNMASRDDKWTGKAFYHQAFYPGATAEAASVSGEIQYSTPFLEVAFGQSYIGSDFVAEAGYIKRRGYFETTPKVEYTFYPADSRILSHGPALDFDVILDPEFNMTDRETQLSYTIGWKNRDQVSVRVSEQFVKLNRDYDPTNTGGIKLPSGSEYDWKSGSVSYTSDSRRLFYYTLNSGYGDYYNGNRLTLGASLNYRVQPYGSIALLASYNNIHLPDPYNSAELILIGPRLDITFTDKLFLTTYVQYNDQIDNINMNIRFQWRFAPVSDLYIVYTGNSYIDDFRNKNRGLVIKFSYWFN